MQVVAKKKINRKSSEDEAKMTRVAAFMEKKVACPTTAGIAVYAHRCHARCAGTGTQGSDPSGLQTIQADEEARESCTKHEGKGTTMNVPIAAPVVMF